MYRRARALSVTSSSAINLQRRVAGGDKCALTEVRTVSQQHLLLRLMWLRRALPCNWSGLCHRCKGRASA